MKKKTPLFSPFFSLVFGYKNMPSMKQNRTNWLIRPASAWPATSRTPNRLRSARCGNAGCATCYVGDPVLCKPCRNIPAADPPPREQAFLPLPPRTKRPRRSLRSPSSGLPENCISGNFEFSSLAICWVSDSTYLNLNMSGAVCIIFLPPSSLRSGNHYMFPHFHRLPFSIAICGWSNHDISMYGLYDSWFWEMILVDSKLCNLGEPQIRALAGVKLP